MIKVQNLSGGYNSKKILNDVSFSIEEGQVLSILGANGSGKSTLLKAMVGILDYEGDIFIDDKNTDSLSRKQRASLVAYVAQSSSIPFDFNVLEIVLMGRFHESSFNFTFSKQDKEEACAALRQVGIEEFKTRVFKNLSGGERQLVLIARALAQRSKIIIMDEPVTGLDLGNQMQLLDLISTLANDGKIIIQTTHYPDHALRVSSKVLWLDKGEILAFGSPEEVISTQRIYDVYRVDSELMIHKDNGIGYILPLKYIRQGH
jgi:iron complex transport system ATP-binding protein